MNAAEDMRIDAQEQFYRIKRGIKVKVPKNVAELIEESEMLREQSRNETLAYRRGMGKRLG